MGRLKVTWNGFLSFCLAFFTGVIALYSFFNYKIFNEMKSQNKLTLERHKLSRQESTLMIRPYINVDATNTTVVLPPPEKREQEFWQVKFGIVNDGLTPAKNVKTKSWFDEIKKSSYDTPKEKDGRRMDIGPRRHFLFTDTIDKALVNQIFNKKQDVYAHLNIWYESLPGSTYTTTYTARLILIGVDITWDIMEHNIE